MGRWRGAWILSVLTGLLILGGCASKQSTASAQLEGQPAKAGATLAYEHLQRIQMPGAAIANRVAVARQACDEGKFGSCTVLRVEQSEREGLLVVRIAPGGVQPLSALAAEAGKVGFRQTTAVDLADEVNDTQRQREQLERQAQRLTELAARKDIAVGDLITLGREQAAVETQRQALQGVAANQQRRLDTNRLELRFSDVGGNSRSGRLGTAFGDLLDNMVEGISDALELLGYGLPFLLLAFPLALAWRGLWRKWSRRDSPRAG